MSLGCARGLLINWANGIATSFYFSVYDVEEDFWYFQDIDDTVPVLGVSLLHYVCSPRILLSVIVNRRVKFQRGLHHRWLVHSEWTLPQLGGDRLDFIRKFEQHLILLIKINASLWSRLDFLFALCFFVAFFLLPEVVVGRERVHRFACVPAERGRLGQLAGYLSLRLLPLEVDREDVHSAVGDIGLTLDKRVDALHCPVCPQGFPVLHVREILQFYLVVPRSRVQGRHLVHRILQILQVQDLVLAYRMVHQADRLDLVLFLLRQGHRAWRRTDLEFQVLLAVRIGLFEIDIVSETLQVLREVFHPVLRRALGPLRLVAQLVEVEDHVT